MMAAMQIPSGLSTINFATNNILNPNAAHKTQWQNAALNVADWPLGFNPNSLWWVHMGISLKERQITEEPMKVKIWKKLLIHKHLV